MSTISDGTDTFTPLGPENPYTASRPSRNVYHDVLGRADPDVSLFPSSTRQGTFRFGFDDAATAHAADAMLARAAVFTYEDDTFPALGMSFTVDGSTSIEYDADTELWTVEVSYREVLT